MLNARRANEQSEPLEELEEGERESGATAGALSYRSDAIELG